MSKKALRSGAVVTALSAVLAGSLLTAGTSTAAAQSRPSATTTQEAKATLRAAANKALVLNYYDRLFNHGDLSAADQVLAPDVIQHNPTAPNGAAAVKAFAIATRKALPNMSITFERVLAQGDLVVVHSHFIPAPGALGSALADIYRIDRGKIVEHWDVIQDVPASTASGNDLFSTVSLPRPVGLRTNGPTAKNERIVRTFLHELLDERDVTAFDRWVNESYYQHNPSIPNGTAAVKAAFTGFLANPDTTIDVRRVVADGDLVAVHSHFIPTPGARGSAVMDIYRVQSGKIVEHWDIIQDVPETSANDNTMF